MKNRAALLDEDTDQRPAGRFRRDEIAHKTGARANFHMAGTRSAVNEDRTDRCRKRIGDRGANEAVIMHQLRGRLFGVAGFWIRIDGLRLQQGGFHITPATPGRVLMSTVHRDARRLQKPVIRHHSRGWRVRYHRNRGGPVAVDRAVHAGITGTRLKIWSAVGVYRGARVETIGLFQIDREPFVVGFFPKGHFPDRKSVNLLSCCRARAKNRRSDVERQDENQGEKGFFLQHRKEFWRREAPRQ